MKHNSEELHQLLLSAEFGTLRIECESPRAALLLRRALYHQLRREERSDFTVRVTGERLLLEHHKRTILIIQPEAQAQ